MSEKELDVGNRHEIGSNVRAWKRGWIENRERRWGEIETRALKT
jgi:hypothetical protein